MNFVQLAILHGIQADLLRPRLEAAGISCRVTRRNLYSEDDKVVLQVKECDADAARAILRDFESKSSSDPRLHRSSESPMFYLRTAALTGLLFWGLSSAAKFLGHPFGNIPIQVQAGSGCAIVSLGFIKLVDKLRAR